MLQRRIERIRLVFRAIFSTAKDVATIGAQTVMHTRIVTCRQIVRAKRCCLLKQRIELYITVAVDAWIRCAAPLVVLNEGGDNLFRKWLTVVQHVVGNPDPICSAAGIFDRTQ